MINVTLKIDDDVANVIVAQLLFLESEDPDADIHVYVNSPGGSVTAGMAIYDTMQYVKPDISTLCLGQAASMGAILLLAGTTGKRVTLPHSRIMIHQPWAGFGGRVTATDLEIQAREMLRMKNELNQIISRHTGQELAKVEKDTDRDYFLTGAEAKEYGIVDKVIQQR